MNKYRVTKVSEQNGSEFEPGFWAEGYSGIPPEVGHAFWLEPLTATSRGNDRWTYFHTSTVQNITPQDEGKKVLVHTLNSQYMVEQLD